MSGQTPKAPAALYIDSNILRKAGWPDPSARLLELVARAAKIGVAPALVELVRRELTEGWIRDLVANRRSLVEKGREYSRRTCGLAEAVEPAPLPPIEQLREHVGKVTEEFTGMFRQVPTTKQPTETFVDLALGRGGAFGEGGKGFNDTVILVSIIEDMARNGFDAAILVSEDRGFQGEGVRKVTGGRELLVLTSIEAVDDFLNQLVSERVKDYLEEKKQELIGTVKACEGQLVEFLREKVPALSKELATVDQVRKVELLRVVSYDDAHSVSFLLGQENRDENRFSVDVRVLLELETQTYLFERSLGRLDRSEYVIHPEDIMVSRTEKETLLTVEGAAEAGKDGIRQIKFFRVGVASPPRGLAALLAKE